MTRVKKKAQRRAISPRKRRAPSPKTGPKKDNLPMGFKVHENALAIAAGATTFIPKIK